MKLTSLQHRFETQGQRERNFGRDESREHPIDPSADDHHGQNVGDVSFQHFGHHARIGHGRLGRGATFLRLEVTVLFVVEVMPTHVKPLFGYVSAIFAQHTRPDQHLAVLHLGQFHFLLGRYQQRYIMTDHTDQERDEDDRQKHPTPNVDIQH